MPRCREEPSNNLIQRVKGADTFRVVRYEDIPKDRRTEICHTTVVCEVRPNTEDSNRTRITVAGNRIYYPGDVATPTGSLELVKLIINSVLSRRGAKLACFDIKNFYLGTPMLALGSPYRLLREQLSQDLFQSLLFLFL